MSHPGGNEIMPDDGETRWFMPAELGIASTREGEIVLVATPHEGEAIGAAMGYRESMILLMALTNAMQERGWLQ
jgi:hypothetical protein